MGLLSSYLVGTYDLARIDVLALMNLEDDVYLHDFWNHSDAMRSESLDRYRCQWNVGSKIFEKFCRKLFNAEKELCVGRETIVYMLWLFQDFQKKGTLRMMADASFKTLTELLDSRVVCTLTEAMWYKAERAIEANIDHWHAMSISLQGRIAWYEKMLIVVSQAQGYQPTQEGVSTFLK